MPRPETTPMTPSTTPTPRVGYVTKMYPRFSETFIVNEVRGLERRGVEIEIFSLRAPVDTFFEDVLVNDDDAAIRANRLALLKAIREATGTVADFSKITG